LDLALLPAINASLNGLATIFLVAGRVFIHRGDRERHKRAMVTAFSISSLFLLLYVIHKASRGFESITYNAVGAGKVAYLALLFSHLTLAMLVPVLAIALIWLAVKGRFESHAKLARWAWPIWMYVSVTGVIIYLLLYQLNPPTL
jgi:uncharacterized membrane protein YozB (DUF420 family)